MSSTTTDPRTIRTRQLLQTALLELMQVKTFQAISVGDIAQRAKLNRATFYLHYVDKFDLLVKTARDTFLAVLNEALPNWQDFQVAGIQGMILATCRYLDGFLRGCSPANKPYEPLIQAEMQRVLYDYIACWLYKVCDTRHGTLEVESAATLVSSGVLGVSLKWVRGETSYTAEEFAAQMYQLITVGLWHTLPQTQLAHATLGA